MPNVKIIIPAYKNVISEYEKLSLIQCCKIFGKYSLSVVCPGNLDISNYMLVFEEFNVKYDINIFEDKYFVDIETYNKLLLSKSFYERFFDIEFILIYQLDSFVFRDELEYWCEQAFDYIGAPWFSGYNMSNDTSVLLNVAGNGGFSLRKIESFIRLLKNVNSSKYMGDNIYEDFFYAHFGPVIDPNFKVAPPHVAMHFSFECQPNKLFQMIGNKLPFGCHAWAKYDPDFWQQFITLHDRNFSIEYSLIKDEIIFAKNMVSKLDYELKSLRSIVTELNCRNMALNEQMSQMLNSNSWKITVPLRFFRRLLSLCFTRTR
jgi:hypothetical protein